MADNAPPTQRRKIAMRLGLVIAWLYGAGFVVAEMPGGWWTFPTVLVAIAGAFGLLIYALDALMGIKP